MTRSSLIAFALAAAGLAPASAEPVLSDTYLARLEATALLQTLNAQLLSHDSATAILQQWCDAHGLAPGARITAERVQGAARAAGADERSALGVGADEPVRHRHVRLSCGGRVLSEADNWYLPGRLTAEMNRTLDETETPFGVVVRPLEFRRRTLAADLLFRPLPEGWEMRSPPAAGDGALAIPREILRHRAVLTTPDGRPFSLVVETYTRELLDTPPRLR